MFEPKYQITDSMVLNIAKFEQTKSLIYDLNLKDDKLSRLRKSFNSKEIFHLAKLLNIKNTIKDAEKIISGKTTQTQNVNNMHLVNFRNAIEYILSTHTMFYSIQQNLLTHLNKILIKGFAEEWDARYRTNDEELKSEGDDWLSFRDTSISPGEIQTQIIDMIEWFSQTTGKVHPLIQIPIMIFRFIQIAPFMMANKITNLAFTKFLYLKTGYSIEGLFPAVRNYDLHQTEYSEAWKAISTGEGDLTMWLEKYIRDVAGDVSVIHESIEKIEEEEKEKNKQPFLSLNRRQLRILRYLQNIPQVKREEYVEMLDVSTMTAFRDLDGLVKKGLIRVEGKGRGTVYVLSSR